MYRDYRNWKLWTVAVIPWVSLVTVLYVNQNQLYIGEGFMTVVWAAIMVSMTFAGLSSVILTKGWALILLPLLPLNWIKDQLNKGPAS